MKCPKCKKEMKRFGVNEKGEDKLSCDDCYIHAERGVITHKKDKILTKNK